MVSNKIKIEKIKIDKDCCDMKSVGGSCPKPLESVSSFLTKKWAISIIITIGNFKKLRFSDLLNRLDRAKAKILTTRLKELENEGIIRREYYNETPPRVEYSLTDKGEGLLDALNSLMVWAEAN